jgi:hypothetical protein
LAHDVPPYGMRDVIAARSGCLGRAGVRSGDDGEGGASVDKPEGVYASVAERIRTHLPSASAAERRIGRALLASYPAAGLDTAGRLAAAAGVSTASVVRYVASLGFAGYREFQDALREELDDRTFSPLTVCVRSSMTAPSRR